MDKILTDFIQQTRVEPSLAHDLLEATEWNVDDALLAYESLKDTRAVDPPEYQYNPSKCSPMQLHMLVVMCSAVDNSGIIYETSYQLTMARANLILARALLARASV